MFVTRTVKLFVALVLVILIAVGSQLAWAYHRASFPSGAVFTVGVGSVVILAFLFWLRLSDDPMAVEVRGNLKRMLKHYVDKLFHHSCNHYQRAGEAKKIISQAAEYAFQNQPGLQRGHSHPVSAQQRKIFYTFIEKIFSAVKGWTIGFYQPANRDLKLQYPTHTVVYRHSLHWAVDALVAPSDYEGKTLNAEVVVDTDYYMQLDEYASRPRLILLYTLQPQRPCVNSEEYHYSFLVDGRLEYTINETGDRFTHRVINWTHGSYFTATTWRRGCMYYVQRYNISEDRVMVALLPVLSFGIIGRVLLFLFSSILEMGVEKSKDYDPIQSRGTVSFAVIRHGNTYAMAELSTDGRAYDSIEVSSKVMGEALSLARNPSSTASSLVSLFGKEPGRASKATTLHRYFTTFLPPDRGDMFGSTSVGDAKINYYSLSEKTNIGDKNPGTALPIATEISPNVPVMGEHAMVGSLARIEEGRAIAATGDSEFAAGYAEEFAQLILEQAGVKSLVPLTPTEVESQLDQPKHKKERNKDMPTYFPEDAVEVVSTASGSIERTTATLFAKNESYPKIAMPRPIINYGSQFKHGYTVYTAPLAKLLKTTEWYAFGVSPKVLVNRLVERFMQADFAAEGDFSKFDSTVGSVRNLEEVMLRTFYPDFPEVLRWWRAQINAQVHLSTFKQKCGSYEAKGERGSGSPETSVLNSLDNALISYIASRLKGLSKEVAYGKLGFYGGDDSIIPDMEPSWLEEAATLIGMKLKVKKITLGLPFSFLGRYFCPWTGSPHSCYDPVRCMSKVGYHEGKDQVLSPVQVLGRKLASLLITDAATPWVVDMVKKYQARFGPLPKVSGEESMNWWTQEAIRFGEGEGFPVAEIPEDWMLDVYSTVMQPAVEEFEESLEKAASVNGCPTGQGSQGLTPSILKPGENQVLSKPKLSMQAPARKIPGGPKPKKPVGSPRPPPSKAAAAPKATAQEKQEVPAALAAAPVQTSTATTGPPKGRAKLSIVKPTAQRSTVSGRRHSAPPRSKERRGPAPS